MPSLTLVTFAITAACVFARLRTGLIGAPALAGASHKQLTVNCPAPEFQSCLLSGQVCETPGTLYGVWNTAQFSYGIGLTCWDQVSNSTDGVPFFAPSAYATFPSVGVSFSSGLFCSSGAASNGNNCPPGRNCTVVVYVTCS